MCWAYTEKAAMAGTEDDDDAVPEPADEGYAADSELEDD